MTFYIRADSFIVWAVNHGIPVITKLFV